MKKNFIKSLSILTLVAANLVAVQPAAFAATASTDAVQVESTTTTLAAPSIFTITNGSGLIKAFGWTKVEGAVDYKIYAEKVSLSDGTKTTSELEKHYTTYPPATVNYEATASFEVGYNYLVYIVAVDADGNTSAPKYVSSTFDYTTPTLSVPSVFTITNGSGLIKAFGWTKVEGAVSYNLFAEKTSLSDGTKTIVELEKNYTTYPPATVNYEATVEFELGYSYKVYIVAVDANGKTSDPCYCEYTIEY